MLGRTAFGEGQHQVAQQHAQVLVVHALHMLHQGWPPQALGGAARIEGTDISAHQAQALIHGLPHLYCMQATNFRWPVTLQVGLGDSSG